MGELEPALKNMHDSARLPKVEMHDIMRIGSILMRNDLMGHVLESSEYMEINTQEKELKGEAKVGAIICIDGRVDTIHPFGRTINVWEEPASLTAVIDRPNNRKNLVSTQFGEALHSAADRDLLEIVFAHTSSTTDHKCGRMAAGNAKGEFDHLSGTLEEKNLALINRDQIPAITQTYNEFRKQQGMEPLRQVAITAMYDTDTMGVTLNYGKENALSTTALTLELKDRIAYIAAEVDGPFGSMHNSFTDVSKFLDYSKRVLDVTKFLLNWDGFLPRVHEYVGTNFPDLTQTQKQALLFTLARTTAAQYITGLAEVPPGGPEHPFAEHQENFMAVSLAGKTLGRFDPAEQVFGSSPSCVDDAKSHIKTKLSLMDKHFMEHGHGERKPEILFVSNPVDQEHMENKGDQSIGRAIARNADLYREIVDDPDIRARMEAGGLLVVPILVDQDSGQVLSVLDHSAYL